MAGTVFLGTFTGGPGNGMRAADGPSKSEGIYRATVRAQPSAGGGPCRLAEA